MAGLVIEDETGKALDITRLDFCFVHCPDGLKEEEDAVMWLKWIYVHYVSNVEDHSLNWPSRMRREYEVEYRRIMKECKERSLDMTEGKIAKLYDRAQQEIWRLMVMDPLMQFKRAGGRRINHMLIWNHDH